MESRAKIKTFSNLAIIALLVTFWLMNEMFQPGTQWLFAILAGITATLTIRFTMEAAVAQMKQEQGR